MCARVSCASRRASGIRCHHSSPSSSRFTPNAPLVLPESSRTRPIRPRTRNEELLTEAALQVLGTRSGLCERSGHRDNLVKICPRARALLKLRCRCRCRPPASQPIMLRAYEYASSSLYSSLHLHCCSRVMLERRHNQCDRAPATRTDVQKRVQWPRSRALSAAQDSE